jgi:hypothetical protein
MTNTLRMIRDDPKGAPPCAGRRARRCRSPQTLIFADIGAIASMLAELDVVDVIRRAKFADKNEFML